MPRQQRLTRRTVSFSRNAVNIFFHILTQCNLKCRHCYINPRQHGRNHLPLSTIEAWLAVFSHRFQQANVIFLGGEPTLHPDLAQAIRAARRLKYTSVTVDTNGYLFHDILNRVSPGEVDFFSFSLDGATPGTNDSLRGSGSWETCVRNLEKAREAGFATSLIYTVSSANLHELHRMPALLKRLGVARFFIQVIGLRGRSANNNQHTRPIAPAQWLEKVPAAAEAAAHHGLIVTYPKVFLKPEEAFECAGLVAQNYFIFPNGRVYRCPLCEDYPLHGFQMVADQLHPRSKINECDLFHLNIPEGCVMNRLVQPDNLAYEADGHPVHRVACCMLKEEVRGAVIT